MQIILLERVEKLGQMGDVVKVKDGYARNYLLPQKKALRANAESRARFEEGRVHLEADNLERRSEAESVAAKMAGLSVVMVRQAGDSGQLYGSVNARDIAAAVTEAGVSIVRQQVALAHPIKVLGLHEVRVILHPEIGVQVVVNVSRSMDEAKIQAKTGKAVVSGEEKAAEAPEADAPEEEAKKPKAKKAEAKAVKDEENKIAEEAANEAVAEQSEEIFEEGAAPEIESPADDADASAAGKEDADAADSEDSGKEKAKD